MTQQPMPPSDPNPPIVAAVDGSAVSYRAAAWAAADAVLYRCPLHLVISIALPMGWGPGPMLTDTDVDRMQTDGEQMLAEAKRIARVATGGELPEISGEVTAEPIIAYLLDRSRRARMLVVGSRGVGALQRGVLGSVSTAVVRHAHCPVVVVHSALAADPISAAQPVLVGVDGSGNSVPALELGFEEASRRKVGLTALHAWSDTGELPLSVARWEGLRGSQDVLLAESLAGRSERYPDVAVRRILVNDRPVRALLAESEHSQLVVVGSHGRGGFAGMLLGSTSNALLQAVECPIVVVRERSAENIAE